MKTQKTIFITVIIIIAVAIIAIIAFGLPKNSPNDDIDLSVPLPEQQNSQTNQQEDVQTIDSLTTEADVRYTNEGFSPKRLEVAEGTTVTFTNETDGSLWIASNPHPVHTDLPALEAQEAVGPGETYQFTFEEIGQWGYHNHLRPNDTGTIYVYPVK